MALTLLRHPRMTVSASPRRLALLIGVLGLAGASAYFAGCGGDDSNANGGNDGGLDATFDSSGTGDAGGTHDSGNNGDGACKPATGCPSSYKCGPFIDPCGGKLFECGMCTGGLKCDDVSHGCTDAGTACANANAQCGIIRDACGVIINCGGCPSGQDCVGGTCKPIVPTDAGACTGSTPSCTLPDGTHLCGSVSDGCGHTIQCSCVAPEMCGGGGIPGECGIATECDDGGACGTFPNGCGSGNVTCGGCMAGQQCNAMHQCVTPPPCVPTNPNPCQGLTCGSASDGCKQVKCGTDCTTPTECYKGQCCTPLTCAQVPDAGCESIDNNCGGKITCQTCGNSERCVSGSCIPCQSCDAGGVCDNSGGCCYPATCDSIADAGCQPVDLGCGVRQVCATCSGTQVCQGDGTCCQPKTCGQVGNPSCQPSDLGCGKSQVCAPCTGNEVCLQNGTCCTPETCNGRTGVFPDGCGGTIVCNGTR